MHSNFDNKYMIFVYATGENSHFRRLDLRGKVVDDRKSTPTSWDVEESGHLSSRYCAYFFSELASGVWVGNAFGVTWPLAADVVPSKLFCQHYSE